MTSATASAMRPSVSSSVSAGPGVAAGPAIARWVRGISSLRSTAPSCLGLGPLARALLAADGGGLDVLADGRRALGLVGDVGRADLLAGGTRALLRVAGRRRRGARLLDGARGAQRTLVLHLDALGLEPQLAVGERVVLGAARRVGRQGLLLLGEPHDVAGRHGDRVP